VIKENFWFWIVVICFIILYSTKGEATMLQRVEKLTDTEKTELSVAQDKIRIANKELEQTKSKIAKAHNMEGQTWMEWKSWYEIDSEFILFYYQSKMQTNELMKGIL